MAQISHDHDDALEASSITSTLHTVSTDSDRDAVELQEPNDDSIFPTISGTSHGSNKFSRWWKGYVFMSVPHVACRDHLGMDFPLITRSPSSHLITPF